MKIDYDLLKSLLTILEEDERVEVRTNDLRTKLNKNITDDQFIGHLLELNDNGCFDCPVNLFGSLHFKMRLILSTTSFLLKLPRFNNSLSLFIMQRICFFDKLKAY